MMDDKTYAKLHKSGQQARHGDKQTGIWVAESSGWYRVGDEGKGVYLEKGTRIKGTWTFKNEPGPLQINPRWVLDYVDLTTIVPPDKPKPKEKKKRQWPNEFWIFLAVLAGGLALFLFIDALSGL